MSTEIKNGVQTFLPRSQADWRNWLKKNHQKAERLWLILYRKGTPLYCMDWSAAVDEALCFGWIDSVRHKRDGESFYQYFCPRKPKSIWSKVNKLKVEALEAAGKMTTAGLKMVEIAKENGTWTSSYNASEGAVPADLQKALNKNGKAKVHFNAFPASVKRSILHWIDTAKRAETRENRIRETVEKAALNIRVRFENVGRRKPGM